MVHDSIYSCSKIQPMAVSLPITGVCHRQATFLKAGHLHSAHEADTLLMLVKCTHTPFDLHWIFFKDIARIAKLP